MTIASVSARFAAALASLCLIVPAVIAPAGATYVTPVIPDPGGGCQVCGQNQNQNQQTTSGNATGGYATDAGNGYSDVGMNYTTPNNGSAYSGNISIVVQDSNGNVLYNYQGSISDVGNGGTMSTGLNGVYVPNGGSVSIYLSQTNSGGQSFQAGWGIRNFHR
jgi:hypothetical protein